MNNTVIKVLNKEHGKKVIEFFKSKGIDTNTYTGDVKYFYYGVKNNEFGIFSNIPNNCIVITLPEDLPIPRMVLAKDKGDIHWHKTRLIADFSKLNVRNSYVCKDDDSGIIELWEHIKEIEEVQEMTLEEVCKELGREIKIIK